MYVGSALYFGSRVEIKKDWAVKIRGLGILWNIKHLPPEVGFYYFGYFVLEGDWADPAHQFNVSTHFIGCLIKPRLIILIFLLVPKQGQKHQTRKWSQANFCVLYSHPAPPVQSDPI